MNEDVDHDLQSAFETATVPLPDDEFLQRLALRIAWLRRARMSLRLGAIVSLILIAALAAPTLVKASLVCTEGLGRVLISPYGWTMSLLAGLLVVRRRRLLR